MKPSQLSYMFFGLLNKKKIVILAHITIQCR